MRSGVAKDADDRPGRILIAEAASCQLEYKYLAHLTGEADFFTKAEKVVEAMHREQLSNGLWDTIWNTHTGKQANGARVSFSFVIRPLIFA